MPQEKKLIDKFKLIETFGVMQKAIEDDLLETGTIYFIKKPSGAFYCRVGYEESGKKPDIAGKAADSL